MQPNVTLGDVRANLANVLASYEQALHEQVDLLVFPAQALTGCNIQDLPLQQVFQTELALAWSKLEDSCTDNACKLLIGPTVVGEATNTSQLHVYNYMGKKIALLNISVWPNAVSTTAAELKALGADCALIFSTTPYCWTAYAQRRNFLSELSLEAQIPLIYTNMVGGYEELVFDGGSAVIINGNLATATSHFTTSQTDYQLFTTPPAIEPTKDSTREATDYSALMLGLRDYVRKNAIPELIISLAGGIDSALAYVLAVDAVGVERVRPIIMPSNQTSNETFAAIDTLINALGTNSSMLSIDASYHAFYETLLSAERSLTGTTEDALEAHIRATMLALLSINSQALIITATNKTELALGKGDSYSNICLGLNLFKDVYKSHIYALAEWRNANKPVLSFAPEGELIPASIFAQASALDYLATDPILYGLLEGGHTQQDLLKLGHNRDLVEEISIALCTSEHKRRQSAPGLKLSAHSFGFDRRYPLAAHYIYY